MPINEKYTILMKKAVGDLEVAKLISKSDINLTENVCFHCQQTVEKSLKAFLAFSQIRFRYIHNLEHLVNDCITVDPSFREISVPCSILNNYSMDIRYIDEYIISVDEMLETVELAEEVFDFVKKKTVESNF